jgi:hypothetical protein
MPRCVNCGDEATRPVWAVYADPAFQGKQQVPFPLHRRHLDDKVTPREWVAAGDAGKRNVVARMDESSENPTALVEGKPYDRYREVEAPE